MFPERQAAQPTLPTSTTTGAVPSGAALTAAIDLTSFVGQYVFLKVDVDCTVRAATTTAVSATAGDYTLEANTDYPWYVTESTQYCSLYGTAAANYELAQSSE